MINEGQDYDMEQLLLDVRNFVEEQIHDRTFWETEIVDLFYEEVERVANRKYRELHNRVGQLTKQVDDYTREWNARENMHEEWRLVARECYRAIDDPIERARLLAGHPWLVEEYDRRM